MRLKTSWKFSRKLPAMIVAAALVAGMAVGFIADLVAAEHLRDALQDKLAALRDARSVALNAVQMGISRDLRFLTLDPQVTRALSAFVAGWSEFEGDAEAQLHRLYIESNPYPPNERQKFEQASDPSVYSIAHGRYHRWFQERVNTYGYRDLILIVPDGRVVYSVAKSGYFAVNLFKDAHRNSRLTHAFLRVIEDPDHFGAFTDFAPDPNANNQISAFLAAPLRRANGTLVGVAVLSVPIEPIDAVLRAASGILGVSRTYLVGQDMKIRTSTTSEQEPPTSSVLSWVDTQAARKALDGYNGVQEDTVTPTGATHIKPLMAAYAPYNLFGIRYALIAEADLNEVLQPVFDMRRHEIIGGAVALIVIAVVGFVLARNISVPLTAIANAMIRLSHGALDIEVLSDNRRDEIGQLARALCVFKQSLIEIRRLQIERERHTTAQHELLETLPLPLLITRLHDNRLLHMNRPASLLLAPTPDPQTGEITPNIFVNSVDRYRFANAMITHGKVDEFELMVNTPNAHPYWALLSARILRYQGQSALLVSINGINERKRAEEQKQIVSDHLANANQQITASIQYASRIQSALLRQEKLQNNFPCDHFLIWRPRDIVGGDFFWFHPLPKDDAFIMVVGDCTGHGVPGALMTMITVTALDRILSDGKNCDPAAILTSLNSLIKAALGQDQSKADLSDDGVEVGVCLIEPRAERMIFAGARFAVWVTTPGNGPGAAVSGGAGLSTVDPKGAGGVIEVKGDRYGVGFQLTPATAVFTNRIIELSPGGVVFLTSDGYIDQIGQDRRKSFGRKKFATLLAGLGGWPLDMQRQALLDAFDAYRGTEVQRDDVTVLGFCPIARPITSDGATRYLS
ncbi:hypothetical protein CCP2SC5_110030 [Azospirillaceae bacterium]